MGDFAVPSARHVGDLVTQAWKPILTKHNGIQDGAAVEYGLSPLYNTSQQPSSSSAPEQSPTGTNGPGGDGAAPMQVEQPFVLPLHTADLGRMPLPPGVFGQEAFGANPEVQAQAHALGQSYLRMIDQATQGPATQQGILPTQAQTRTQVPSPFSPLNHVNAHWAGTGAGTGAGAGGAAPFSTPPFSMRLTEYSELLDALSSAPSPHGHPQGQGHSPASMQSQGQATSPFAMHENPEVAAMAALAAASGSGGEGVSGQGAGMSLGMGMGTGMGMGAQGFDTDVSMMSAESFAFPDSTMEMWSEAPATFE